MVSYYCLEYKNAQQHTKHQEEFNMGNLKKNGSIIKKKLIEQKHISGHVMWFRFGWYITDMLKSAVVVGRQVHIKIVTEVCFYNT